MSTIVVGFKKIYALPNYLIIFSNLNENRTGKKNDVRLIWKQVIDIINITFNFAYIYCYDPFLLNFVSACA